MSTYKLSPEQKRHKADRAKERLAARSPERVAEDAAKRSAYYYGNRPQIISKRQERIDKAKAFINNYKLSHPCSLCGETDPVALDFHHLNPQEKEDIVSYLVGTGYSEEDILKEVSKCIVLCSNCHRKLHARDAA